MPDQDDIARHAYGLWEQNGRPAGRDLEFWVAAETAASDGPPVTNLDRGLSPAERSRARAQRHGGSRRPAGVAEAPHYTVVIDRAHLRIYQVREPANAGPAQFELAEAFDLPAGRQQYTDRDTDMAGRFPGGSGRALASGGGTVDERLPMQSEHERRLAADLAGAIARFLSDHADATWDYAAGPGIHRAVLDQLPASVRDRLGVALVKEIVHQSPAELRAQLGRGPRP